MEIKLQQILEILNSFSFIDLCCELDEIGELLIPRCPKDMRFPAGAHVSQS